MKLTPLYAVTLAALHAKAKWTQGYLRKHPDVADELSRSDVLTKRFDAVDFQRKTKAQYAALQTTGLCDEEAMLDLLRRAHHIEVFRILVRDTQGLLSVRDVADELSSLADSVVSLALPWCWERMPKRPMSANGQPIDLAEHFCVVAYGKLGGKELGYGSDLDIVFIDDPMLAGEAAQQYPRLVQRLISWLTVQTTAGRLFEIDTALRPNGQAGLMLSSVQAFADYQMGHSAGTHAWLWEHQAISRARLCAGDAQLKAAQFLLAAGRPEDAVTPGMLAYIIVGPDEEAVERIKQHPLVRLAGAGMLFTGWTWLDPAASLLIVTVIFAGTGERVVKLALHPESSQEAPAGPAHRPRRRGGAAHFQSPASGGCGRRSRPWSSAGRRARRAARARRQGAPGPAQVNSLPGKIGACKPPSCPAFTPRFFGPGSFFRRCLASSRSAPTFAPWAL